MGVTSRSGSVQGSVQGTIRDGPWTKQGRGVVPDKANVSKTGINLMVILSVTSSSCAVIFVLYSDWNRNV